MDVLIRYGFSIEEIKNMMDSNPDICNVDGYDTTLNENELLLDNKVSLKNLIENYFPEKLEEYSLNFQDDILLDVNTLENIEYTKDENNYTLLTKEEISNVLIENYFKELNDNIVSYNNFYNDKVSLYLTTYNKLVDEIENAKIEINDLIHKVNEYKNSELLLNNNPNMDLDNKDVISLLEEKISTLENTFVTLDNYKTLKNDIDDIKNEAISIYNKFELNNRNYIDLGLDVKINSLFGVYSKYFEKYTNGDKVQAIVHVFKAQVVGGELISHNDETLELKYFELIDVPPLFNKQHQDIFDDLISNKGNLILTKYLQIDDLKAGENKNFTLNFRANNIVKAKMSVTDEYTEEELKSGKLYQVGLEYNGKIYYFSKPVGVCKDLALVFNKLGENPNYPAIDAIKVLYEEHRKAFNEINMDYQTNSSDTQTIFTKVKNDEINYTKKEEKVVKKELEDKKKKVQEEIAKEFQETPVVAPIENVKVSKKGKSLIAGGLVALAIFGGVIIGTNFDKIKNIFKSNKVTNDDLNEDNIRKVTVDFTKNFNKLCEEKANSKTLKLQITEEETRLFYLFVNYKNYTEEQIANVFGEITNPSEVAKKVTNFVTQQIWQKIYNCDENLKQRS